MLLLSQIFLLGMLKSQDDKLPVDEKVKIGKLDNGLVYYIRENNKPEDRIEMRLVVNAGSILEEENQRGLAHFVEHMCFNGTKNFEKNEIIQYLESVGIKFGPDLNAYTSFDETVYMLTVPSDSAELVDKGFLILEDWAFNLTMADEEIDKERGVIIEEWRMGRGPWQRMQDKYLPALFNGARYAERLPIGKKEVIEGFEYETLRSFYKDWYRPDLMAVVVVGDMDAELVEEKIKKHFSEYIVPADAKQRVEYTIPGGQDIKVSIATDKEAPVTVVRLFYKDDAFEIITEQDYMHSLKYSFITGMLNRRIMELTEKADPPIVGGVFYYSSLFSRSKNGLQGYAIVGESGIERGIKTLLEENKRIADHGFTAGEFERFKLDLLKSYEKSFNERDKTESESYAGEYVRNYLENEPIPGIEFEYELVKNSIDKISLEVVNKLAAELINEEKRLIVVNAPEKEGLVMPEKSNILALAASVDASTLEPYKDKLASTELMAEMPAKGSIVDEKSIESIGATELKLSNGATVLLKPTAYKNDEVRLSGFASGGTSVYGDEDHFSAMHSSSIVGESGISDFSKSDLTKVLAGKSVYVASSIGTYSQNISASARPTDLKEMFQLIHLRFTKPRIDEESFQSYVSKNKDLYKNLSQEPMNYFYDKYNRIMAQNHPRGNYTPVEPDWEKIDYSRVIDIYKESYSNAADFTFIIVGAFDLVTIKPLIEQYIASLPSTNSIGSYRDLGIRPPNGMVDEQVVKGTDEKSMAIVSFRKKATYNNLDNFLISQLGQLLTRKYYEILREEMSGVYNVRASASLSKIPYEYAAMGISIPCSPDNADKLVAAAVAEIKNIQENGISKEDVAKAQEIYKREKEKRLEQNGYWLGALKNCYIYKRDFKSIPSFELMDEITSEAIQRVAKEYINSNEYIKVVLYPELTE